MGGNGCRRRGLSRASTGVSDRMTCADATADRFVVRDGGEKAKGRVVKAGYGQGSESVYLQTLSLFVLVPATITGLMEANTRSRPAGFWYGSYCAPQFGIRAATSWRVSSRCTKGRSGCGARRAGLSEGQAQRLDRGYLRLMYSAARARIHGRCSPQAICLCCAPRSRIGTPCVTKYSTHCRSGRGARPGR